MGEPQGAGGEREICRDFLKGVCFRGNCRYMHAAPDGASASQPICRDFENGRCFRASCRFYHRTSAEASNGRERLAGTAPAAHVTSSVPNAAAAPAKENRRGEARAVCLGGEVRHMREVSEGRGAGCDRYFCF
ncbi:hypothetical protein CYMTET_44137 [Cymbomonas tetramitiformis]|uniref:C3H1-type domain-containing protein n=1 Tax=Cymbomonas tetramitiformis TaxID=36881 RepID=A0AAE0EZM2_9CHLO|nr:hypothetical protein CYMTET_44137 [Cymbomonas tetramitiformis]